MEPEKLTVQREQGPRELAEGLGLLVLGVALLVAVYGFGWREFLGLEFWLLVLLGPLGGVHRVLSRRRLVLDRGSRRVTRDVGLGVPFVRHAFSLHRYEQVELRARGSGRAGGLFALKPYSVHLHGPGGSLALAGSRDRDEALLLARAVSQHLDLTLRQD
ncbi:hypothetical protein DRW03_02290 [Corallococcus sp. H22C18031201]|nr:hypothetical protein DRW03_02290 [Corallococcus sp. H22C18031201]